jgi:acylphosphatase
MPTVHLLVKGKVQGVFYRVSAKEAAETLHLTGWVKNTAEGNVEIKVSGDEESIKQFIEWSKRGPKDAVVHSVIVTQLTEELYEDFKIIRG